MHLVVVGGIFLVFAFLIGRVLWYLGSKLKK